MILIKASTKDDITNAISNYPGKKVYGISPSANIYTIDNDNVIQLTTEEVIQNNNISPEVLIIAINKIVNNEAESIELNEDNHEEQSVNNEQLEKQQEQEQPQEVSIEELANNLNDIVDNFRTNDNNDKLDQLEKRVEQLEKTITNLKDTIISDIRIKLSR